MQLDTLFNTKSYGLKKQFKLKDAPIVPDTGWKAPQEFPNLSAAVALSIDTENKEFDWPNYGPGWGIGKSNICGFSIGAIDAQGSIGSWYFPIRHEFEPQDNLDPDTCL